MKNNSSSFPPPPSENNSTATTAPDNAPPLAVRIVRGGFTVALTSYFLFGFGFLANLVLTRLLTPADFGIFSLATFFFSLFNLRLKSGVEVAFAQHPRSDAEASGTFAVLNISTALASLLVALIAIPILRALNYESAVLVALLVLAAVGVSDAVAGIAWGQLDKALLFTRVNIVTIIAFPLAYLPAFYLAYHGAGYWALLSTNILYSLLLLVGLWFTARRALPEIWNARWKFSAHLARQFLRFGMVVGLATIFATLVYQFDNFLVGTFVSVETLGYYDRAYRIAQWSSILVTTVLARTAFYAYSRLRDDSVRLTKTATMSLWIVTMLAVPIALAIFVSADELVMFLFGPKWMPSVVYLRFLVVYSVLRPLLEDANSLFVAIGKPRRTTIVSFVQAVVILLAATPLTFQWGAVGTAIGVGITFVAGLGVTYFFIRRTLPALNLWQAFLLPTLIAIATLVITLPLAQWLRGWNLPLVILLCLEASSVMAIYFTLTFFARPQLTRERAVYVWRLMRNRTSEIV